MKICYFDESGDSSILTGEECSSQPMFALVAVTLDSEYLPYLTKDFIHLKRKYFPNLNKDAEHELSWILKEIKGSNLRKDYASDSRNTRRHSIGFILKTIDLLEKYNSKIFGMLWIKQINGEFKENSIYTNSVQYIFGTFQRYLEEYNDYGLVIGDSRSSRQNSVVSHGIFSGKMSARGDRFGKIVEIPTFAQSENSAMLQIADLINSAMVWPIGIETFCNGHLNSVHVKNGYSDAKSKIIRKLSKIQYRYEEKGKRNGGLYIRNKLNERRPKDFFSTPEIPLTITK